MDKLSVCLTSTQVQSCIVKASAAVALKIKKTWIKSIQSLWRYIPHLSVYPDAASQGRIQHVLIELINDVHQAFYY